MNDAKGHASNLLILSLATALVGAGILSWSLTQSSFFQERPRPASSLAIKNTVSESIMTNQPAQNPVKIKIPDVKPIQAEDPDVTDEPAEKTPPDDIIAQEQVPETPAGEAVLAEKIILPETMPQEEAAAAAPEAAETSEVVSTEIAAAAPEADTSELISTEIALNEATPVATEADGTDAPPVEVLQNEETPLTTEVSATEVTTTSPEAPTEGITNTEVTPQETATEDATSAEDAETLTSIAPPEEISTDLTDSPEEYTQLTTDPSDENTQITERQKDGWIYAGQYTNGKWVKRGLELPDDKLPDAGNIYKLVWGTNVRLAPPGKRTSDGANLAKNIDYLAVDREIEITSIKNSGKTGHIWLEIKY